LKSVSISFICLWEIIKKSCWGCGSSEVIRWGFQGGKQRLKCKHCGLLFTRQNKSVAQSNRFVWFRKWVLERQTLLQLSKASGYSVRSLKSYFHQYLAKAPILPVYPKEKLHLIIDGTYFSNNICLIIYRDNEIKFTQLYRLTDDERYEEIREDLNNLLSLGIHIASITCDGHRSILKAIKHTCKDTIVQRCIVHIQRECRSWLTLRPQSKEGLQLLQIVNHLHLVANEYRYQLWLRQIYDWHEEHKDYINEKSRNPVSGRYWYKHKMVRKSFIYIKNALPNMFHYLKNDKIPKSTNGLESYFGHLKNHVLLHRGLTKTHRKNFIKWYIYFRNKV
jgi:hypothetical protein